MNKKKKILIIIIIFIPHPNVCAYALEKYPPNRKKKKKKGFKIKLKFRNLKRKIGRYQ